MMDIPGARARAIPSSVEDSQTTCRQFHRRLTRAFLVRKCVRTFANAKTKQEKAVRSTFVQKSCSKKLMKLTPIHFKPKLVTRETLRKYLLITFF